MDLDQNFYYVNNINMLFKFKNKIFFYFCIFILCIFLTNANSRNRVTSPTDVWCSTNGCSAEPQTTPLALNVPAGAWNNDNQKQLACLGGDGAGDCTFTSNTPNICTVTEDGVVTRLAIGNCSINVTKEADLVFAALSQDVDFEIGCENQNLAIQPGEIWTDMDTKRLVLNGAVGSGAEIWMSLTPNICTVDSNDPNFVNAVQLAKGTCTVQVQKNQDNQLFACADSASASFTTGLFSAIRIDNNRGSCPAGWTNPTSAVLESALAKGNLQGQVGLRAWYYCINGYNSFVKTADGYYKYKTRNGGRWRCPGARNQSFKTTYPWSKHSGGTPRAKRACSTCGTTSVVCLQ